MTNYEQLKKKICEALPRLMEIKKCQNLKRYNTDFSVLRDYQDGFVLFDTLKEVIVYEENLEFTGYAILGIEPTLSDCLEYVKQSNYVDGVNMMTEYEWNYRALNTIHKWDLSQPLLKDQSEELIEYLLGL